MVDEDQSVTSPVYITNGLYFTPYVSVHCSQITRNHILFSKFDNILFSKVDNNILLALLFFKTNHWTHGALCIEIYILLDAGICLCVCVSSYIHTHTHTHTHTYTHTHTHTHILDCVYFYLFRNKEEITEDRLQQGRMLIIGGPQDKFTAAEVYRG